MVEYVIKRVFMNKASGQKLVSIPKKTKILPGDYVRIVKVEDE
jgi:hypothetical protein